MRGVLFRYIAVIKTQNLLHFCASGKQIRMTLTNQFPNMSLLEAGYKIQNHTGRTPRQSGGTCGPWSLWTIFAFAFNFRAVRGEGDAIRYERFKQEDAMAFWRAFTA